MEIKNLWNGCISLVCETKDVLDFSLMMSAFVLQPFHHVIKLKQENSWIKIHISQK